MDKSEMVWLVWISLQFLGLVTATPIVRTRPGFLTSLSEPLLCPLPPELGKSGTWALIEDCEHLDDYNSLPVPSNFFSKLGTNSIVCCPHSKAAICFSSDPWCPNYVKPDNDENHTDYDENYADYSDYPEPPSPIDKPTLVDEFCENSTTTCVPFNACSQFLDSDENQNNFLMIPCGFDDINSRVKVCCPNNLVDNEPIEFQNVPRFPDRDNNARTCQDKDLNLCRKWQKLGGCSKDRPHILSEIDPKKEGSIITTQDMFDFMILTCQDSCDVCGSKGCIDEHPRCKEWAKTGSCFKNPEFMGHTCRESCGTCGFLSPDNREEQVVGGNSYSDFSKPEFHCGEYKLLCQVNGENCDEEKTTTTTTPSPIDPEMDNKYDLSILFSFANTNTEEIYCGLTFITDRFAVEAAHCWQHYQKYTFGDIKYKQFRDATNHKELITVKKVYRHPLFNYPELYDDIAVVELSRRVEYDFDVYGDSPSCLDRDLDLPGRNATSVGYGLTEFGTRGELLATKMKIITNDECTRYYNYNISAETNATEFKLIQTALPYGFDHSLICTQGFQNDKGVFSGPCRGDSGSPLSTKDDNDRDTLVGIVSGGHGCGLGIPPWYTRVSFYYEWIACIVRSSTNSRYKGNQKKIEDACRHLAKESPRCENGGQGKDGLLFNLSSDSDAAC